MWFSPFLFIEKQSIPRCDLCFLTFSEHRTIIYSYIKHHFLQNRGYHGCIYKDRLKQVGV